MHVRPPKNVRFTQSLIEVRITPEEQSFQSRTYFPGTYHLVLNIDVAIAVEEQTEIIFIPRR